MTSIAIANASPAYVENATKTVKHSVSPFVFFVILMVTSALAIAGASTMSPVITIAGGLLTVATAITFAVTSILSAAKC